MSSTTNSLRTNTKYHSTVTDIFNKPFHSSFRPSNSCHHWTALAHFSLVMLPLLFLLLSHIHYCSIKNWKQEEKGKLAYTKSVPAHATVHQMGYILGCQVFITVTPFQPFVSPYINKQYDKMIWKCQTQNTQWTGSDRKLQL